MNDVKELATYLHDKLCRCNHTDSCGWFYVVGRNDEWDEYSHKQYLKKAEQMINICSDIQTIKNIVGCIY